MAARAWGRRRQGKQLMMAIRKVSRRPDSTVVFTTYDGFAFAVLGMEKYEELERALRAEALQAIVPPEGYVPADF